MKNPNHISQLTLELYHRGLATRKERKQVENALAADNEVRKQYEELQKSDSEIRQLVAQEIKKLNKKEIHPIPFPQKKKVAVGLLLAAAVLICAIIPAFLYFRNSNMKTNNAIAEEAPQEVIDDMLPETLVVNETNSSNDNIEKPETPPAEQIRIAEPEIKTVPESRVFIVEEPAAETKPQIQPESGVYIAAETPPDTGIRMRGDDPNRNQSETPSVQEEPSNINIPPGLTFIFENMFANKDLTFVIIPNRITSIGKNAFLGNPLLSVTIGSNVSIEDNAIPGNFAAAYNANGKTAGTYTRPDTNSEEWNKK